MTRAMSPRYLKKRYSMRWKGSKRPRLARGGTPPTMGGKWLEFIAKFFSEAKYLSCGETTRSVPLNGG